MITNLNNFVNESLGSSLALPANGLASLLRVLLKKCSNFVQKTLLKLWRRGQDSNLQSAIGGAGFRNRCITILPPLHQVPERGFEPPRDCSHYALNVARLPFRHSGLDIHFTTSLAIISPKCFCSLMDRTRPSEG